MNSNFTGVSGVVSNGSVAEPWLGLLCSSEQRSELREDASSNSGAFQYQAQSVWNVAFWASSYNECCEMLKASDLFRSKNGANLKLKELRPAREHRRLGNLSETRSKLAKTVSSSCRLFVEADDIEEASANCHGIELTSEVWSNLLNQRSDIWCAFVAMDALHLTQLVHSRGYSETALGILFGSEQQTVHIVRVRDFPEIGQMLDTPECDIDPVFIFPGQDGDVDFDLFLEPGSGFLGLGNVVSSLDENEIIDPLKLKEVGEDAINILSQGLPADRPLMFDALGQKILASSLTRLTSNVDHHGDIFDALLIRGENGAPEFYKIPQVPLKEVLAADIAGTTDPLYCKVYRDRIVRHALFDLAPNNQDRLAFIAKYESESKEMAAIVDQNPMPVPYFLFLNRIMPVIIEAVDKGIKLGQVSQVNLLWQNVELSLLQKIELFENALSVFEVMQKDD